ncbi:hypothetical protein FGADI_2753 [Fusarium gaditjirri]|uniref:Gamma-glutamyltranspeptidase n=1 Tax=Fusarium gaditjirri TaxID=282569 RepID=A0A8H4THF4_9HYPO|nr:hypothetical protein FGADI_2753 [Fusarium gaditjirri]
MPLPTSSIYEPPSAGFTGFPSRRSVVHSTEGIVAAPQPHAANCGLEILRAGGNAADAAVAVAAGLNVTEPVSTGIGGDMFLLYFDAATKQVKSLNGSGRSGSKQTLENIRKSLKIPEGKVGEIPTHHVHAATVPGAAAGWVDTVERFGSGKVSLSQILEPAIKLAENGFPLTEIASHSWQAQEKLLRDASPNFAEMLKKDPSAQDGVRAPRPGEVFKNPTLAQTFRTLATEGKKGFYTGRIAEEIVKVVQDLGGYLELDDLKHHLETGTQNTEPISVKFRGQGLTDKDPNGGVELWEHPPNGQGIVALMALGIIEQLEKQGKIPRFTPEDHNSTAYLHAIIEALRLGFTDASWYVTDPDTTKVPTAGMISPSYLAERAKIFSASKAHDGVQPGNPDFVSPALQSSDTVYFTVTDSAGNAASFINSNYAGFGTAIIPKGCGFTLQNRGANFSLDERHPNKLEPRKRPYHTIIPGMATNITDGSLHSTFGVMGGFNQPQGTIQVLLNQVLFGLNPQQALDAPRICIGAGMPDEGNVLDWTVHVEEGISEKTVEELKKLGHNVVVLKGWKRDRTNRELVCEGKVPTQNEQSLMAAIIWTTAGTGEPRFSYFCAGDGNVPLEKRNICHERLIVTPGHQYGHPCWDVLFLIRKEDNEDEKDDLTYTYEDALKEFLMNKLSNENADPYESIQVRIVKELEEAAKKGTDAKYKMKDYYKAVIEAPSKDAKSITEEQQVVVQACDSLWNTISEQRIKKNEEQTKYYLLQLISANHNELDGGARAFEWPTLGDWSPKAKI